MALQNTARAKQQSRNTLIMIVVLVLLVLSFAAFFLLGDKPKLNETAKRERPPGTIAVPIVARKIKVGEMITSKKMTLSYIKPSLVPTDAIIPANQFINRMAARNLTPGEYIKDGDFASLGANQGYSGITRLGKRTIALSTSLFPEYEAFKSGDHLDLLSIINPSLSSGIPSNQANANKGTSLADSSVTMQGGGINPGDKNSQARQRARARNQANNPVGNVQALAATLIAENAEIISATRRLVILQMEPQDAHITSLAIASGAQLRVVFRPFNDNERLTNVTHTKITTRLPRPALDPDAIIIYNGATQITQMADSDRFVVEDNNSNINNNEDDILEPLIQNIN